MRVGFSRVTERAILKKLVRVALWVVGGGGGELGDRGLYLPYSEP